MNQARQPVPEPRQVEPLGLQEEGEGERVPERHLFTDFVRALDPGGGSPDEESLRAVLHALRRAVTTELRRRGLWESPPNYLGVYGCESWSDGNGEALEDLLTECYTFIFIQRLSALQEQLRVKPNIEGLIILNIRHFLHERQREHDPLGFRVFESVRKAIRRAVDDGDMQVLAGDPRVKNETILGFRQGQGLSAPPAELDLSPVVRRWNDELLPDLVTAQGRGRESVLAILRRRLRELEEEGIETLRFKDLVDPFKHDVRARWAAILENEPGEIGIGEEGEKDPRQVAALLRPDRSLEAEDTYRKLVACISDLVEHLAEPERTRSYLATLWMYLRTSVAQEQAIEGLPSYRKLGELLDVPRERLPELFRLLQELAEQCRAAMSGKVAVIRGQGLDVGRQGSGGGVR